MIAHRIAVENINATNFAVKGRYRNLSGQFTPKNTSTAIEGDNYIPYTLYFGFIFDTIVKYAGFLSIKYMSSIPKKTNIQA
jgi:hypothetical protein